MGKVINPIIGSKFNQLEIIENAPPVIYECGTIKKRVKCRCECGNEIVCVFLSLRNGHTKSCGCKQKPYRSYFLNKYGVYHNEITTLYSNIIARCYNVDNKGYHNYGGRGISVCSEWVNSFYEFYEWCISNGWKKSLEIDRRENDGNYTPSNCRFVARQINALNKRPRKLYEYEGQKLTITQWSQKLGIGISCLKTRLLVHNCSVEVAFSTPIIKSKRYNTLKRA